MAAVTQTKNQPLSKRIVQWPRADENQRASGLLGELKTQAEEAGLTDLAALFDTDEVRNLMLGTLCGSPYLTSLIRTDLQRLNKLLNSSPEQRFSELCHTLSENLQRCASNPDAMAALRNFKSEVALLTALCDLGGLWPVMRVTDVLTRTADAALSGAVRYLFQKAQERGDWLGDGGEDISSNSGYIVLGMGKYGAHELNYSSDIDLIVFFDSERVRLKDGLTPQRFFVQLTQDLVSLMEERTSDGYVFRTDLRLRPDAGATQIALSTDAAMVYYESFGQNWERAALVKARPVAGDISAGHAILRELEPFVWRKYLDFAAIADVHAMKRQIHAFRRLGGITLEGHNIKLGSGGIREIEFFAQTQQLIAGGRQPALREPQTLKALDILTDRDWIKPEVRDDLQRAYRYLRHIEHRLQMVMDEQTHELPRDPDQLARLSRFCGYETVTDFAAELTQTLECVQSHYVALFEDNPELTARGESMVFAGQEDHPDTLTALKRMGYSQPSRVIAAVRSWHHGRYPAVRAARSRERLTEVQPVLLDALADTSDPDAAFANFDRFLSELPTGVQLFSLLRAKPRLLRLVADIMGTAPRLARILSRRARLLDAVIDPRILGQLPTSDELDDLIQAELSICDNYETMLDRARVVGSEQSFLLGVRVLSGAINADLAGSSYALLAERLIVALKEHVERDLMNQHGSLPGGSAAIVAMGKLGGYEITAGSDLDLIVVYDFEAGTDSSNGNRPLAPSQYYARLTQRLITALSAPTAEGQLYEVDMRLRPSGQQGPVATQFSGFESYQMNEAWTWEHMALTRARVIAGPEQLSSQLRDAIKRILTAPRDPKKIAADVREMRNRIAIEKKAAGPWDLKYVRGGLVDIEFVTQYLQLIHAAQCPEVLNQNTLGALEILRTRGCLSSTEAEILISAARLVHNLTQVLRICVGEKFDPQTAARGLKDMLARAADAPSFATLEVQLAQTLSRVADLYEKLIPECS